MSLVSSQICPRQPQALDGQPGVHQVTRPMEFGSGNWSPLTFGWATTGQLSTGFPCCKGPPATPIGGPRGRHRAPPSIGALAGLRSGSSSQLAGNGHLAPISGFQNAQTRPKCNQMQPPWAQQSEPLHPLFVISHRWCGWEGRSRPLFLSSCPAARMLRVTSSLRYLPAGTKTASSVLGSIPTLLFVLLYSVPVPNYTGILFVHDNQ